MEKANFFSRFMAYIIDNVIIGIVAWIITLVVSSLATALFVDSNSTFGGIFSGVMFITAFVYLAFAFFYFGYFWADNGQSLGMRLLNIKVVRRTQGEEVSLVRGGLRGTFGYWISSFIFGLGFLWALFDADGETWHDKIFDTRVVVA